MARRSPSTPANAESATAQRVALWFNDGLPLAILAMALVYSDRLFTILRSEAELLSAAAQPLGAIWAQSWSRLTPHNHPLLYDLGMHLWLRASDAVFLWLRAPSILFFLAGLWLLSRAARRIAGLQAGNTLLWLGALWPYGFHYGRLADWYSLAFLLVAGLTWSYLRFCEKPGLNEWYIVCAFGILLVYVDYFGWLLLLLLGLDDWLRNRKTEHPAGRRLLTTAFVFGAVYAPFWSSLAQEIWRNVHSHPSLRMLVLTAGYNVYVLLASESVAPWYWQLGVPVMLAIVACLALVYVALRWEIRRLLIFAGVVLLLMDLFGGLSPERLLLVAPWVLLPLVVALGAVTNRYQRRILAVSLITIGVVGWYGIFTRRHYANVDFFEPWPSLAADAAGAVLQDGTVISNSPQFFVYLTYALRGNPAGTPLKFSGFLPETVRRSNVWSIDDWLMSGRQVRPYMLWIRGTTFPATMQQMDKAAEFLDGRCGGRVNRYLVRDPAYMWKQRLAPQQDQTPWRIEVHQYDCGEPPAPAAAPAGPPASR